MRIRITLFPAVALLLLAVAGSPGAVPVSVLDDPSHPLSQSPPPTRDDVTATQALSNQALDFQSGDTVLLFCDVATFQFGDFGGTDCWGWRDAGGNEYAIMGVHNGIAFVNTTTLETVEVVPGPENSCGSARWRDMKTYQHYAYAVSECTGTNDGLMVIDLQYLPDSVHFVGSFPLHPLGYRTSHNLSIDTVRGYAYAEGLGTVDYAVHILSLADPENPTHVNSFGIGGGIHDMYARNDTVYVAEGWNPSFSIWDLTDKMAPSMLVRVAVPASGYVHNIWPTDDGQYVVTTEETANKTVKVWDVSNLQAVSLVGQYLGGSGLAHNAQVMGDTVYISHYESGVTVVDISTPTSPVEIAKFDTYPGEDSDFNGCWGAFPYTSNGYVYGSNMNGTLYVIQEDEVILADTMWIDTVTTTPASKVRLDVHVTNTLPLRKIVIPVDWSGPHDMVLDSVSTVGLRTEYFAGQKYVAADYNNDRIAYSLTSSPLGTLPDLDPGSGPVLSLFFSVPPSAAGDTNPVSIVSFNGFSPVFVQRCISYVPDTLAGAVAVEINCCIGFRGNVNGDPDDKVNVEDLTFLVDYLFRDGAVPPCIEEANVDGDASRSIAVTDITYLVEFLFKGGPIPAFCP